MSDISPSKIQTDAEFEAKIARMTNFEEIRAAMRERALEQGLVREDLDPYHLIEVHQGTPKTFAEVVEFGGHKGVVEGPTELAAAKAAVQFYRDRLSNTQQTSQTQSRDEQGRFQSRADEQPTQVTEAQLTEQEQNRLMDMVDARAALLRGEITSERFAEITLRHQGLDPETLRAIVEERQDAAEVQSWADAVETFRNSPVGAGWPGGNRNRDLLVSLLTQHNLMEATDKVAALSTVYAFAKQNSLLVENEEVGYEQALAECQSQKEIDAVNARYKETLNFQTNQGSTFWGSQ